MFFYWYEYRDYLVFIYLGLRFKGILSELKVILYKKFMFIIYIGGRCFSFLLNSGNLNNRYLFFYEFDFMDLVER